MQFRMVIGGDQKGRPGEGLRRNASASIILVLLAAVVAFTGGASRFDAIQIVPLRSLSAVFLFSSLFFLTKESLRAERALFILFGCFALILVVQLVPLPPWLWRGLPGRVDIFRLDSVVGLEALWRPLTLTPLRSWNVLGSLVVPAAGLLTAVALRASALTLLRLVAGLGVLNALFGLLQIMGGRGSVFYFYEVTNRGSPVGLFANENHAAIFAATSMLLATFLGLGVRQGPNWAWQRLIFAIAFCSIFFVSLIGGSRAGFVASIGAMMVSIIMFALAPRNREGRPSFRTFGRWLDEKPRMVLAVPIIVVMLIAVSFVALGRTPAVRDILANDSFEDLRWTLMPVTSEMLRDHWAFGTGLGSFEQVYQIYEPSELLMPYYVNQAHNDWAQLVIEGGLLAGALLIGLLLWVAKAIWVMSLHRTHRLAAIFWTSALAIVAAASLIDYPLRTPLFQLTMVWLLVALSQHARDAKAT